MSRLVLLMLSFIVLIAAPERSARAAEQAPTIHSQVHDIIEQIAALPSGPDSAAQQQVLFDQLAAMGPDAVPAIVALMDDRRRLPVPQIALPNRWPDAFEGTRHYGPELMVDALAAILNQITGEDFGSIHNGGTEAERQATIAGWRRFLQAQQSTSR